MQAPEVNIRQWIHIGDSHINAYVLKVINPKKLYIGYYQNNTKAIGEYVIWDGKKWIFESDDPCGTYLKEYEAVIVKSGPYKRY